MINKAKSKVGVGVPGIRS
jgi:hypothetical protein